MQQQQLGQDLDHGVIVVADEEIENRRQWCVDDLDRLSRQMRQTVLIDAGRLPAS